MRTEIKQQIVEAAAGYMAEHGVSQNDLAKKSNVSYLSNMMNGRFTYTCPKSKVEKEIKDMYFEALAKYIGFPFEKEYWPVIDELPQFRDVITELLEAKQNCATRVIFGEAGSGKTFAVEKFKSKMPVGTFVVTCFKPDKLKDLVWKIEDAMRLSDRTGNASERIRRINMELYKMSRKGEQPIIIFDESESLTLNTLPGIKDIYDAVFRNCGIVLIGTNQLYKKLTKMRTGDKDGIPQLYSRLKAGFRYLDNIDREFKLFFEKIKVDKGVRATLIKYSEDYRNLNRYLEDALRQADAMGQPLTDKLFRQIHKLPLL